jgi:hypothetical protein
MMLILLALQAAPLAEMKSSMQPVSVQEGVALFQQVCFAKFPDPKAAMEIIADPALGLTKLPETPSQAMQPGDAWTSPKAQISYVDAEWMPMDMGSPQCSVTVVIEGQPLHSTIAGAMTTSLQLPLVKFGKDAASAQTRWDIPQPNGDKWRMFLSTSQTPSGTEMRTVIMNLRGKKKK